MASYHAPNPTLLEALVGSKARTAILAWLADAETGSTVSELARLAGVTPPAARAEVLKLAAWGLVRLQAVGAADLVEPNRAHSLHGPLRDFVRATRSTTLGSATTSADVRNSLAAYGAPLAGARPRATMSLEEAIVAGLGEARTDATVLRTLPVVLSKNEAKLDWHALKTRAYRARRKMELGMVVELTADLLGRPELRERVADLHDRRVKKKRYFLAPRSSFERALAERNSPPAALRWGFYLNMGEDAFRSTLEKHLA